MGGAWEVGGAGRAAEARGGVGSGLGSWRGGATRAGGRGLASGSGRGVLPSASPRASLSRLSRGARILSAAALARGERLRARLVAAVPVPAPSASGRSSEGGGALPDPPPLSLAPGKNVPPAVPRSRARRPEVKNLEEAETKAAFGTDELGNWVWADKRCERRAGEAAMATGEPLGLEFLGVAP